MDLQVKENIKGDLQFTQWSSGTKFPWTQHLVQKYKYTNIQNVAA